MSTTTRRLPAEVDQTTLSSAPRRDVTLPSATTTSRSLGNAWNRNGNDVIYILSTEHNITLLESTKKSKNNLEFIEENNIFRVTDDFCLFRQVLLFLIILNILTFLSFLEDELSVEASSSSSCVYQHVLCLLAAMLLALIAVS